MRPDIVTDEHLDFLDFIRDTGKVNMMSMTVREALMKTFEVTWLESKEIHLYWMKSFGDENR
jgi:hypothetical protein